MSTADLVVALPNIGREGGTYLYHILNHWDELPAYTLFTQAQLKKAQQLGAGPQAGTLQDWLVTRLRAQFAGTPVDGRRTGFMSLDRKHDIGYCGHFTDLGNRDEFYPLCTCSLTHCTYLEAFALAMEQGLTECAHDFAFKSIYTMYLKSY